MRSKPTRSARSQKTQQIIAALVPAAILLLSVTGFVWAQRQVSIVVDGRTLHVATQSTDVAGLLSEAGVAVGDGDLVFPSRDTKITPGLSVVVRHAIPVAVVLGGTENKVQVVGKSVADALVAAGVDPADTRGVTPPLDTALSAEMRIEVPDSFARVSAESTSVPFKVERRPEGTLPKGMRRVLRHGACGTKLRVFRTLVTAGVGGSPTLVREEMLKPPVAQVEVVGTGDGTTAHQLKVADIPRHLLHRTAGMPRGKRLHVVATAYSAAEPGASSSTASGVRAERGVIAVDPSVIPLGTHVYVPGYGYAIAGDTGRLIKGHHVDLCFNSMAGLNAWGRRFVTIILLD
jgi:resuscitation-promoting factor RpfB